MTPEPALPAYQGVSRRSFLITSGAASISVMFGALAPLAGAVGKDAERQFAAGSWVTVGTDNVVTIVSPGTEIGQGTKTAMPLMLAEDMDLDWARVQIVQAKLSKAFGNPAFGGDMTTGGSRTTRGYYDVLRIAGHQARLVLLMNAAAKWNVPIEELSTGPSMVIHQRSRRKMSYGEIAAFAEVPPQMPVVTLEQLKPASQFRLIGKDVARVDLPDKVVGRAVYGVDLELPGMLWAVIMRPPVQGERPLEIDDGRAKRMPGVKAIVPMPYGVGVVATSFWSAQAARKALQVTWSDVSKARSYNSDKVREEYLARSRNLADQGLEFVRHGDPNEAIKAAPKTYSAEFTSEHVTHATLEPVNCTCRVDGDRVTIWAPTQSPSRTALTAQRVLGAKPENIEVYVTLAGGGFGRRVEPDVISDALLMAKACPGVPVKVVWSREDDTQQTMPRPLVAQHLTAALDANGKIMALRHRLVSESIYARAVAPVFAKMGGRDQSANEGAEHLAYDFPHKALYWLREERGVDVGFWRGVGGGYTKFAIESFIDELAHAAEKDPIAYRLEYLADQPRARAVIEEVAKMSGWNTRKLAPGHALGFAYSDAWESHIAGVAEVSVNLKSGQIKVHEFWSAIDPGIAIQPINVALQTEGSIIFGVSGALVERSTYKNGVVQQSNFHDYPVLRMSEAPLVHVKVMPNGPRPGGVGETGLPPVAPAIANAVFKLTNQRLRALPLTLEPAIS
jgi:isoquinoline 1-oxidoreductase beta subunit